MLRVWASTAPKETGEGLTLRQEIKRIDTALRTNDQTVLAEYGGFNAAMKKGAELEGLPEARVTGPCCMDHPEGCLIMVFFNTGDNLDAT